MGNVHRTWKPRLFSEECVHPGSKTQIFFFFRNYITALNALEYFAYIIKNGGATIKKSAFQTNNVANLNRAYYNDTPMRYVCITKNLVAAIAHL